MIEFLLLLWLLRFYRQPAAANDAEFNNEPKSAYPGLHYEGETEYLRRVK